MSDPTPIQTRPTIHIGRSAQAVPSAGEPKSSITGGVAFQALIENLEAQARELEERAASVANPADLAGAVDRAHASLQDALSLSDRLLEAYRESLRRDGSPATADERVR